MAKILDQWNALDAGKKRTLVLIGVGGLVMVLLWGYVANEPPKREKAAPQQPIVKSPLTGAKETSLGVEALAAKLSRLEGELKTVKGDAEMHTLRQQANFDALKDGSIKREAELKAQLDELNGRNKELEDAIERVRREPGASVSASTEGGATEKTSSGRVGATSLSDNPAMIESEWAIFDNDATDVIPPDKQGPRKPGDPAPGTPAPSSAPKIQTIGNRESAADVAEAAASASKTPLEFTIPSGSILRGVLITGVDAPTGQQSKTTPMPALVRIKHEGILPNYASWDVTECFVLLSGYGDLSTERYMGRAERLSCVSDTKQVLDVELEAFATGEDGKAGIRGRLVTRMGQALLNSGIAGFFSGAAQAFGPQRVPIVSTNADEGVYTPSANTVLGTGAGQGASQALNQIAEFYIKLAEQTLPVVEVDAAREVEMVLVRPLAIPTTQLARR